MVSFIHVETSLFLREGWRELGYGMVAHELAGGRAGQEGGQAPAAQDQARYTYSGTSDKLEVIRVPPDTAGWTIVVLLWGVVISTVLSA